MQKLLSIVIPVFKVEAYITRCLDSLIVPRKQLDLLDILIINDSTPDLSADMAREYVKRFPGSFRVIDQENRGHGGAWNHGTELAKGKYLYYLDSDDWFDTGQFSKLIGFLQECDTDLVLLNRTKYYSDKGKEDVIELINMVPGRVYNANTYDWSHCGNGSNITYAHNTVYRTSMMQRYLPLFCEHVMYDDIILQVMPIMMAESFVFIKLNVYHYLVGRPGQSFDPAVRAKHADDVTTVLKQVLSFIHKYRNITPSDSTKRAWVEDNYSAFATHHYCELSLLPYRVSKEKLSDWDVYVRDHYSDIKLSTNVKLYRVLPFPLYFIWAKNNIIFRKEKRLIKRITS